jgi:hypothetical protein
VSDHVTAVLVVPDTVAVNCLVCPGASVVLDGLNCTATTAGAEIVRLKLRLTPLSVPAITAVPVVPAAIWTVNDADVEPAGTVTEAGIVTGTDDAPLPSETIRPPEGAGPVKVAVQELEPGLTTVAGLQARPESCGVAANEIVPPVALRANARASGDAPEIVARPTGDTVLVVDARELRVSVATTPSAMARVFNPETMQFCSPATGLAQVIVFAA